MRILLLGKDGQLGWELLRALAPLGELVAAGRREADLCDIDALRSLVRSARPHWIVNAAAYTAVDRAETDTATAWQVNADAVRTLAEEAHRLGAWLVHYSTDYVFDGAKQGAYSEDDSANPLSAYGRSKLEGERAIRHAHERHLILRTGWVHSARGSNFPRTMLRLGSERERLQVVCDQWGAPTAAELVADVSALAMYRLQADADARAKAGTYHVAAAGRTNWHSYAVYVLEQARALGWPLRVALESVEAIPTAAYPAAARRPCNSCLDTSKLQKTFGLTLPDWRLHAGRLVAELVERR